VARRSPSDSAQRAVVASPARTPGRILREHAPELLGPLMAPAAPPPVQRSWGRRILGALLLAGSVGLVSCQALVSAISPGIYG
jgi:hypothetical protein